MSVLVSNADADMYAVLVIGVSHASVPVGRVPTGYKFEAHRNAVLSVAMTVHWDRPSCPVDDRQNWFARHICCSGMRNRNKFQPAISLRLRSPSRRLDLPPDFMSNILSCTVFKLLRIIGQLFAFGAGASL